MKLKIILFLFSISLTAFSQCPPHVQASTANSSHTLNCYTPTLLATGTSTTPGTEISWMVPSTPSLINSFTVTIGPPNGPPTTSTSFAYANYTVVATNTLLGCTSTSVININQNFRPPFSTPPYAENTQTLLCKTQSVIIHGGTYLSQWPPFNYWINPCWQVPSPATPTCGVSQYTCYYPGTYSLTVMDNYNGCYGTKTITVIDSRPQLTLQGTAPTTSAGCNGALTIIPPAPQGYTFSASSGSLNGTSLTGLCYGWAKVCLTDTVSKCVKCDSLLVNEVTGIEELFSEKNILLFPNPTTSSSFLQLPANTEGNLKVFSSEGRLLREILVTTGQQTEISGLNSGLYFLEIISGNVILRKKLLVIR